jgi:hypothetical protein
MSSDLIVGQHKTRESENIVGKEKSTQDKERKEREKKENASRKEKIVLHV